MKQITRYNPALDSRMVPEAQVPPQDIAPWLAALSRLVTDRNHYEDLSASSRSAALAYIANLNVLPFEELLRTTKRRVRTPATDRLSPEKRKLLAQRLRQKTWFPRCEHRLFSFPYAGGGTLWCHGWNACPVLLPGRETRIAEKPFERMDDLIPALEEVIAPLLNKPFTFFGHSMGAGMAFELAHALARHGRPLPSALFVSSAKAPHLRLSLPEPAPAELLEQLRRLGRVPENDDEWMRLIFPVLMADARLYRNYRPAHDRPLNIPIFAYCGDADPSLTPQEMEPWRRETTGAFHLRTFPGGHFYFQTARAEFLDALARDQADVTGPSASKSS